MRLLLTVLWPLIFSILVAYLLNPVIVYLEKQKIPRKWGILVVYLVFFIILFLFVSRLLNDLLQEIDKMAAILPRYMDEFADIIDHWQQDYRRINIPPIVRQVLEENMEHLQDNIVIRLERFTANLLSMLGQLLSLLLVPLFAFYFLKDGAKFKRRFIMAVPSPHRQQVLTALNEVNETIGLYIRGAILVSFLVGGLVYLGLLILGVEFSLLLGVFNGLTNFIPYFGPFIGAVPAIIFAFLQSPSLALKVIILIFIVQQVESLFITPQILGRNLKFHPMTVIFLIITGSIFFGFFGLVFAVPFAAVVRTCWKHFHILKFPIR